MIANRDGEAADNVSDQKENKCGPRKGRKTERHQHQYERMVCDDKIKCIPVFNFHGNCIVKDFV